MNSPSTERTAYRRLIWKMLGGALLLLLAAVLSIFLPIWDIPAIPAPSFPAPQPRTAEQVRFRQALQDIVPAKPDYDPYWNISHQTADKPDSLRFYESFHEGILPGIPGLFELRPSETASAEPEDSIDSLSKEARICSKLLLLRVHNAPTVEEQIHWSLLHLTFAKHYAEGARTMKECEISFSILRDALNNLRFLQTSTPDVVQTTPALREALAGLPPLRDIAILALEDSYRKLDSGLDDADLTVFNKGMPNFAMQKYHWIPYAYQPSRTRKIVLETVLHEIAVLRNLVPGTSENPMQKYINSFKTMTKGAGTVKLFFPGTWRNIVGTVTVFNLEGPLLFWRKSVLSLEKTRDDLLSPPPPQRHPL
jgi:hypothetical protein